jgi:hypothetical protein
MLAKYQRLTQLQLGDAKFLSLCFIFFPGGEKKTDFFFFNDQKYLGEERESQDEPGSILMTTIRANGNTMGLEFGGACVILLGHLKMM